MSEIVNLSEVRDELAIRVAEDVGLVATRTYKGAGTPSNLGGFRIIDPYRGIEAGERFELSAVDVIRYCRKRRA